MAQPIRTHTRLARGERRDQIVDAAARVLRSRDPAEVTFEEIADAAGVSRALLYNYFGDRHGLLDAVEQRSLEQLEHTVVAAAAATSTTTEAVEATVRAHLQTALSDPAGYRLAMAHSPSASSLLVLAGPALEPGTAPAEVPLVATGLVGALRAMVLVAVDAGVAEAESTLMLIATFVRGALAGVNAQRLP